MAALSAACADCGCSGCCPNCPNGRGIYISQGSSYCVELRGRGLFCPEAWVTQDGGVALEGRFLTLRKRLETQAAPALVESVVQLQAEARLLGVPVKLAGVTAALAQPTFHVEVPGMDPPVVQPITTLQGLELTLKDVEEPIFQVNFVPAQSEVTSEDSCSALPSYKVMFRPSGGNQPGVNYCQDPEPADGQQGPRGRNRAFFLPEVDVLGTTGAVSKASRRVTMACGTGAIATCMRWGFRPWEAGAGAGVDLRHLGVFGTCLQAKRAAYFPDEPTKAYAVQGTLIGIHEVGEPTTRSHSCGRQTYRQLALENPSASEAIEAVWTPGGASCLNPERLRVGGQALPDGGLPECKSPELGEMLDGGYLVTTPQDSPLVPQSAN